MKQPSPNILTVSSGLLLMMVLGAFFLTTQYRMTMYTDSTQVTIYLNDDSKAYAQELEFSFRGIRYSDGYRCTR